MAGPSDVERLEAVLAQSRAACAVAAEEQWRTREVLARAAALRARIAVLENDLDPRGPAGR